MALKVLHITLYGGNVFDVSENAPIKVPYNSGFSVIAKVKSRKQFSEVTGVTTSFISAYASETGNCFDIAVTQDFEPGTVFVQPYSARNTMYMALGLNESKTRIMFDSSREDLIFTKKDFGL